MLSLYLEPSATPSVVRPRASCSYSIPRPAHGRDTPLVPVSASRGQCCSEKQRSVRSVNLTEMKIPLCLLTLSKRQTPSINLIRDVADVKLDKVSLCRQLSNTYHIQSIANHSTGIQEMTTCLSYVLIQRSYRQLVHTASPPAPSKLRYTLASTINTTNTEYLQSTLQTLSVYNQYYKN